MHPQINKKVIFFLEFYLLFYSIYLITFLLWENWGKIKSIDIETKSVELGGG